MDKFKFWMLGGLLVPAFLLYAQAQARDGPTSITQTPTPAATATATPSPSSTPFPTPAEPKPPRQTQTPTPDGVAVSAGWTVNRCQPYVRIVVRWLEMEMSPGDGFDHLTLDDLPLILSIMAAESGCDPHTESYAGAIGLMGVIPRDWLPDVRTNGLNVYTGMYILDRTLTKTDGDLRRALGAYNCGFVKLDANECGSRGGYAYAEHVLHFWLPLFTKGE